MVTILAANSRQDAFHDFAVDIGQAEVAAGEAVRELLVVEPQQVQDRGVQVVDVDAVFDRRPSRIRRWRRRSCRRARRRRPATS